jgi:hypothetical protein
MKTKGGVEIHLQTNTRLRGATGGGGEILLPRSTELRWGYPGKKK